MRSELCDGRYGGDVGRAEPICGVDGIGGEDGGEDGGGTPGAIMLRVFSGELPPFFVVLGPASASSLTNDVDVVAEYPSALGRFDL